MAQKLYMTDAETAIYLDEGAPTAQYDAVMAAVRRRAHDLFTRTGQPVYVQTSEQSDPRRDGELVRWDVMTVSS